MARHSFCVAVALACRWLSVAALRGSSSSVAPASITAPPQSSTPNNVDGSCSQYCGYTELISRSFYWSQWITPVTIGTVFVVVDDSTNKTSTTTQYHSVTEYVVGGRTVAMSDLTKKGIFSPANTPMTASVFDFVGSATVVTYPTPWYTVEPNITWAGRIPYVTDGVTKCSTWGNLQNPSDDPFGFGFALEASPLPTHPPWSTSVPPVDPTDPFGNWYTMQDSDKEGLLKAGVKKFWPNDPFLASIYDCTPYPLAGPGTAVETVTALLATSTKHVRNDPAKTSESAEQAKPGTTVQTSTTRETGTSQPETDPLGTPTSSVDQQEQSSSTQPPEQSAATDTTEPPEVTTDNIEPTEATTDNTEPTEVTTDNTEPTEVTTDNTEPTEAKTTKCTGAGCFIATGLGGTPKPPTQTEGEASTASTFLVEGSTLAPGSTITVSGTTYSLPQTPTAIYVDGKSQSLPANPTAPLTISGVAITPAAETSTISVLQYVIETQTLLPGSAVVASGTTFSLPASGTEIYVNYIFTPSPASGAELEPFSICSVAVTPAEISATSSASASYSVGVTSTGVSANGTIGTPSASYSAPLASANGAGSRYVWSRVVAICSTAVVMLAIFT